KCRRCRTGTSPHGWSQEGMMDRGRRRLQIPRRVLSLTGLALWSIAASSQETASIVGTVTDQSGAAVPSAKVSITNTDNGFVRNTTTNPTGNYSASSLGIGHYTVRVEAPG